MKFYIGQHVKKVRGRLNIGHVFVVDGFDPECPLGLSVAVRATRAGFCERVGIVLPTVPGEVIYGRPDDLEPIIPPGLESIEDINALYEPQITEADIPSEVWQR